MKEIYLQDIHSEIPQLEYSSAIIGNFDGFHIGHVSLYEKAKKEGLKRMIITFDGLSKPNHFITSLSDKKLIFETYKVDYLVIINFENFKNVFYNEFIKILKKLNVREITCGTDFRFGFKQEGDIIDLENNFKVNVCDKKDIEASTTEVKNCLINGDIEKANYLLGRPYKIASKVIHGDSKGSSIGYPTANIDSNGYLIPKVGSYLTEVFVDGEFYYAMTNIGHNPTINKSEDIRVETHIFDFNDFIYDKDISIFFLEYMSEEIKFSKVEDLITHLDSLKEKAKKLIINKYIADKYN